MNATEIRLELASFSHAGGRDYNEDALGNSGAEGGVRLFMLADGAGGQGGGDVASKTAIAAASSEFMISPVYSQDTLRRCITRADADVRRRQSEESRLANMASTFVALLVDEKKKQAMMGNLGDSRCYIFRGSEVIAMSHDHSLVQRFIEAGLYPAEKLRDHPRRNILYASLGANSELVEPFVSDNSVELQPGDGVMLCSDGVWELVQDAALGELHAKSASVVEWRDRLTAAVRDQMSPGHDNFSALLVRCLPCASAGESS